MWVSRVEKTISAAHHNGPPDNKCANNHGHDWRVIVQFTYDVLNEWGWGPDFGMIKRIIDSYDHGVGGDLNVRLHPDPPSAENFARELYTALAEYFGFPPDFVEVHEGNENSVRYEYGSAQAQL